jgi:hypothetical protein
MFSAAFLHPVHPVQVRRDHPRGERGAAAIAMEEQT